VPRKRKALAAKLYRFASQLQDEAASVLESNSDATDSEIRDAVNRWWAGSDNTGTLLTADDVAEIRASLGIPKIQRKPRQKKLFD
jgi:hypothetical protein